MRRYRPRRAGQPLPRGGTPNVPPHQVLEADRGADFATITRNHLALLDLNAAIEARFLSEPDWLNLYGLPNRYEEHEVNGHSQGLQLLRAQRTVFVIWNMPDKVKKLSNVIIPNAAKSPVLADAVAQLPVFNAGDALCAARSDYIRRLDRRQRRRRHTCGTRTDGTVACWGSNTDGYGTFYGQPWTSVETVGEEQQMRELMPRLVKAGAEGIIEFPLNKLL